MAGTSKDIAIGGILFENKEPLAIGTKIQVSIPITEDSEPLLLIGTIVRVEMVGQHKYGIGMILSFKEMEKTAKDEISKFLTQQSKKILTEFLILYPFSLNHRTVFAMAFSIEVSGKPNPFTALKSFVLAAL